jgi:hypothetical protein
MVRAVVLIVAAVLLAAPAAAQCMKDDAPGEIAEGQLTIGNARDAAGRPERPYILRLPVATCLASADPTTGSRAPAPSMSFRRTTSSRASSSASSARPCWCAAARSRATPPTTTLQS